MTSMRCSHWRAAGVGRQLAIHGRVLFFIARRADFNDAHLVARADIHGLRRNVHPADVVRMGAANQAGVVIMHPIGIGLAQPRPVVGRPLGVTREPDKPAVQPDAAGASPAFELRLPETGGVLLHIHDLVVHGEDGINLVKIGRRIAPELRPGQFAAGGEGLLLAVHQIQGLALKRGADFPAGVHHHGGERDGLLVAGFIAHLRFEVDVAGFGGEVKIRRIDIYAGGLQIFVQGQGLIHVPREMQPEVVVQPAVIGIECPAHPFVTHARRFFPVIVAVVHLDRNEVFLVPEIHEAGQVETAGGDAVFKASDESAVHPKPAGLFQTFKLQKNLPVPGACGELEMLAIPGDSRPGPPVAAAVADDIGVGIHVVVRVGGAYVYPF